MYYLSDKQYELEVYINNVAISELGNVAFHRAVVYEDLCDPIPSCLLEVTVPITWLDGRVILDGTPFKFKVFSKKFNLNEEYEFRILNLKKIEQNQRFVKLEIEGLLDVYDIYSHPNEFNMYGRTSDIFKKAASTFKWDSEIDTTNDEQLWCSGGRSVYDFFNYLASYGWRNETSAMVWALDRHKILLYKDLADLFYSKSNKIRKFVQSGLPVDGCYCYNSIKSEVLSGKNNFQNNGYGASNTLHFNINSYDYERTSAKVVRASSNHVNVNPSLVKGLNQDWCVLDVGNFNKNYYLAYLQNKRVLATYSTYLTISSNFLEQYRLGQIVSIDYTDSRDRSTKIDALSGYYMLNSITIVLTSTAISCELGAMLQGLNS